jgi:hypothetical protein
LLFVSGGGGVKADIEHSTGAKEEDMDLINAKNTKGDTKGRLEQCCRIVAELLVSCFYQGWWCQHHSERSLKVHTRLGPTLVTAKNTKRRL